MGRGSAARALAELAGGAATGPVRLWEFAVRLRLLGDTHVGAAHDTPRHAAQSDVDLLVDRDPGTGVPRLRATTLAGLLRHELARRAGTAAAGRLFGGAAGAGGEDGAQRPSPLHLDDATAELPEGTGVSVRVGTRVDPDTGVVARGALWQTEVLPAGTVFTAHLRLHVVEEAEEAQLLALLAAAADGLTGEGPGVRLGGRGGRGYGAVRAVAWRARRHDLTGAAGWFGYYGRTWESRHAEMARDLAREPDGVRTAVAAALGGQAAEEVAAAFAAATVPDGRRWAELRMRVAVGERPTEAFVGGWRGDAPRPGLLMVGEAPGLDRLDAVDRAHRRRPAVGARGRVDEQPVLGDTALFALLKRIGRRLAGDLAETGDAHWRAWHDRWWGADTAADTGRRGSASPSRIRLRRIPVLAGGTEWRATRLTVDALFADAVEGRLSADALHCGGQAEVVLDVWEPDEAVLGMLTLVVRELATVPFDALGAGAGVGHGRLAVVSAALLAAPGEEAVDVLAALTDPGSAHRTRVRRWVDAWVAAVTGGTDDAEGS
ncbi:CRISPR-associated protein [Thermobifida halotolerans]|uniref:CRISPR-associated protein n=2 Tax=Thermobifida halotolerans TaxID=483545 RepID=A0AA97M1H5_9ACTN|nr:RAMP superfamily CRISPR-associated protein [Thermobifida halotolerans]UOE21838.1 CRISPR-associated protein [Thermobifida halotolerans]